MSAAPVGGLFSTLFGGSLTGSAPAVSSAASDGYSAISAPFIVGGQDKGIAGTIEKALPLVIVGGLALMLVRKA
ncbi:hypothetical protein WH96_06570 [Kiloniella spongiae]|uniref:Uncharacterized protein n=1 Tax=Kiloniella spongiae TaxID=1489064 RepID=A0A0H2MX60_9PROT|nr:hypothetical protein [Kiloniella spongiae]KLN61310.1 hypothetical protein WH96_06570 [Kiloniella spongiae]